MKKAMHFTISGMVLGALLALASASTTLAQQPIDKLDVRLKLALARSALRTADAAVSRADRRMHDLFLTGEPGAIRTLVERHGGRVRTVAGDIITAMVPEDAILAIASATSVHRVQGASAMRRFNETAAHSVAADRVWTAPPAGEQRYTGKGVIVGIIDTGIDWMHPDFRDPNDSTKSRILRIWDQNDSLGTIESYDYGTEWTKEQIDAALAAGDTAAVRHRDREGHGTHVAGTAAGNALATGHHRGMAYNADIAVVSLKWQNSTSLVDAAAYLFDLGERLGRPVVINMSLGSIDAPRDGSDAVDIALDNLLRESSGRALCVAAGNLGDVDAHWSRDLRADTAWTYARYDPSGWGMDPTSGLPIVLKALVPIEKIATTKLAIGIDSLAFDQVRGVTPTPVDRTEWRSVADILANPDPTQQSLTYRNGSVAGRCIVVAAPEGESHLALYMVLSDVVGDDTTTGGPMSSGADYFRVMFTGDATVHMWVSIGMGVDTSEFAGRVDQGYSVWDNRYSVTSPGTARTALTVGAYSNVAQFEDYSGETVPLPEAGIPGELAFFSSVGPSFDGRQKPEIVAPGHGVISSLATNLRDFFLQIPQSPVTSGGYHAIFSGTSMACPVVTGSVALYLERNPTAGYERIREAITRSARADAQTASFGPLPNAHWGHGKLDIYDAIYQGTSAVDDDNDAAELVLGPSTPNPATAATTIGFSLASRQDVRLEILDLKGIVRAKLVDGYLDAGHHETRLDAATLEPGVYTYRLTAGGATRSSRLTVVR